MRPHRWGSTDANNDLVQSPSFRTATEPPCWSLLSPAQPAWLQTHSLSVVIPGATPLQNNTSTFIYPRLCGHGCILCMLYYIVVYTDVRAHTCIMMMHIILLYTPQSTLLLPFGWWSSLPVLTLYYTWGRRQVCVNTQAVPESGCILTYFSLPVVFIDSQHCNVATLFIVCLHLTHNSTDILTITHCLYVQ